MDNQLKPIDFTGGIKSENIQYNFGVVVDQIARERLAIAGHGISSGMGFRIEGFTLIVEAGSLIDVNGKEVFFNETRIVIQPPRITTSRETVYNVGVNGTILLENVPYATTRLMPAQYALPTEYGISIVDYGNTSKTLPIMSISDKTITTDSRREGQPVLISYRFTNKRYDTVYIAKDLTIKVAEGITSSSPSVSMPQEYSYILGFVEVDPFFPVAGKVKAVISVKKDMKHIRNIYTDSDNKLFIRGVAFDDLQIIHMDEPEGPTENQLWYDAVSNKLRTWRTIDGISQWVNVNDTSVIPVLEYKIWTPDKMPAGRQMFLFHYTNDMQMRFTPGRNSLEIIIDQAPLHSDQFQEVTIQDAINDAALRQLLITEYGYPSDIIDTINSDYENVGIGFKFGSPLDRNCYVEAKATHRVNENPLQRRFQRTATFVAEDSFTYDSALGRVVTTNAPYRLFEGQLEVFIDGRRCDPKGDIIEGVDLEVAGRIKGAASRQFQFVRDIPNGSRIAYKITSTVYSYDHVEGIMGDIGDRVESAEANAVAAASDVAEFISTATSRLNNMQSSVDSVVAATGEHANFIRKDEVVTTANLPASINNFIPKGLINTSVVKAGTLVPVPGIKPEDFVLVYDMQAIGGNSILRRGVDYEITEDSGTSNTYVNFINASAVPNGNTLYITGIKFKA